MAGENVRLDKNQTNLRQ